MKPMTIPLGYEVGSGEPVAIPLRHLCVCGQTQLSGKTTTLEALVARSERRAIAFRTKRAEASFRQAHTIPPYFRERADWQFVSAVLEATLRERLKYERSWIMRVCKGAQTLADVHTNVKRALAKARGTNENVYLTLDEYLNGVTPQLGELARTATPDKSWRDGLNVMDLVAYSPEVQGLIIRSVLEWVHETQTGVIVVIPEAWKFLPQGRNTPVKLACEQLTREGAGVQNFVWLDSQDLAGVDKTTLRQVGVWILGVQRERNEVKRTLEQLDLPRKPKAPAILQLGLGEFFVCHDTVLTQAFVRPQWVPEWLARGIARREEPLSRALEYMPKKEEPMEDYQRLYQEERAKRESAEHRLAQLQTPAAPQPERELTPRPVPEGRAENATPPPAGESPAPPEHRGTARSPHRGGIFEPLPPGIEPGSKEAADVTLRDLAEEVLAILMARTPPELRVAMDRPAIVVEVRRPRIEVEYSTMRGRLAELLAEGFFDGDGRTGNAAMKELARRGFVAAPGSTYGELDKLAGLGFVTVEQGKDDRSRPVKKYCAVAGMKVRILDPEAQPA